MTVQVAFLRAINVGNRRVAKDRLRAPFEDLGLENVSTFIASGNVLFRSPQRAAALEASIETALASALGFDVTAFVRRAADVGRIVGGHPFVDGDAGLVHVGFLKKAPSSSVRAALEAAGTETDEVTSRGREIYWLARGGMGRATVSGAALEKIAGAQTTFRSLKMLRRLHAKLG